MGLNHDNEKVLLFSFELTTTHWLGSKQHIRLSDGCCTCSLVNNLVWSGLVRRILVFPTRPFQVAHICKSVLLFSKMEEQCGCKYTIWWYNLPTKHLPIRRTLSITTWHTA